jgi:hypothetical protein
MNIIKIEIFDKKQEKKFFKVNIWKQAKVTYFFFQKAKNKRLVR